MNILQRMFKSREKRDFTQRDPEGWRDIISPVTSAGVSVSPTTALGVPAALRAVTLLSGVVASLPIKVYKKSENGREVVTDNAASKLLRISPNPLVTPFVFKELIMNQLLLSGNFYAFIERENGIPLALWPLDTNAVTVEKDTNTGAIIYKVHTTRGVQIVPPYEMLHILAFTLDGIKGISPIALARETLGGAIAELKHGHSFFKNGAALGGVLQHPGNLGAEAAETLRTSWRDKYAGGDNAGKVAVLEEGMTFQPVTLSNKDSQWLESRQVTVLDIARIFGVPPALLGHLEKASYSSQEAQNLEFLTYSLRPWLTRIEEALQKSLLDNKNLYIEFTTGDLLRADLNNRFNAYRTALNAGFMSVNEIRRLENLPAVEGGEEVYKPLNMGLLGKEEQNNENN